MDHQAVAQLLGNYGEFIGSIAVLATLVYLSIQIKNSTAIAKASIRQARADSGVHLVDMFVNSPYLPDIGLKLRDGEKLTESEMYRWRLYTQIWHRSQETTFLQVQEGLLDASFVEGIRTIISSQADSALFSEWEGRKLNLHPEYVAMVEDALATGRRSVENRE